MYEATTRAIRVSVTPEYLENESAPEDERFVWAYTIEIHNQGRDAVTLRARHWHITDARGRVHEVRGVGVVGEQPVLQPGDVFEYTSGVPLATPSGIMMGTYEMTGAGGEVFLVQIPAFSLDLPDVPRTAH